MSCKCYFQYEGEFFGTNWTYADGSDNLGPVPTGDGGHTVPTDPDVNDFFGKAMESLTNNQQQNNVLDSEKEFVDSAGTSVRVDSFGDLVISLSPFVVVLLWAFALLALCINAALVVRCVMKRKKEKGKHAFAEEAELDVDVSEDDQTEEENPDMP